MGWDVPWYSAQDSADALLAGRRVGMFYLVCYLRARRQGVRDLLDPRPRRRGHGPSYGLLDLTVHGRQERWEDSPAGWPQRWALRRKPLPDTNGRPIAMARACMPGRSDASATARAS
jgi:hypothetical protein